MARKTIAQYAVEVLRRTDNPAVGWGDAGLLHEIAWRARQQWRGPVLEGPVELHLRVGKDHVEARVAPCDGVDGRQDLDNVAATIKDALEGVCYVNDRQVCRLIVERVE